MLVRQLVEDAGLQVARCTSSTAWKPGDVAFIGGIATALRNHGRAIVSAALTNLAEAFPDQIVKQGGSIFTGLVSILARPPEGFDPDRLFRALLLFDADDWGGFVERLKGGRTRGDAMRQAILEAYGAVPAEDTGTIADELVTGRLVVEVRQRLSAESVPA